MKISPIHFLISMFCATICGSLSAQDVCGVVQDTEDKSPLGGATVMWLADKKGVITDIDGKFCLPWPGKPAQLLIQMSSYQSDTILLETPPQEPLQHGLRTFHAKLKDPITVTAFASPIRLSQSPLLVTKISRAQLETNISPTLSDALLATNGLVKKMDCGVCGTAQMQINGLDGNSTMLLIDNMPVMGSLASVYGLSGLPPSLIERVEIIKGPASTIYGTEAIGGVINLITRKTHDRPHAALESWINTHGETQVEATVGLPVGKHRSLLSMSGYHMGNRIDENNDGFTDVVLADRVSVFNKWSFDRKSKLPFNIAGRIYAEDRHGGQLAWQRSEHIGSEVVYGEYIETRRGEFFGNYSFSKSLRLETSFTAHDQQSWYADEDYFARQYTGFANLLHSTTLGKHNLTTGITYRHQYYDDSTPATEEAADNRIIPGIFVEDFWRVSPRLSLQGGMRLDHHQDHGFIPSPRLNAKWDVTSLSSIRINGGSGFRVVNLFTEEHAAISGARRLEIEGPLDPERSWSGTLAYSTNMKAGKGLITLNVEGFYTYFTNRILPDYSDPQVIRYANLEDEAVTRGGAITAIWMMGNGFTLNLGTTILNTWQTEDGEQAPILFAPDYTLNWTLSYRHAKWGTQIDYVGVVFGPMQLPEYAPPFDRDDRSQVFTQQNLQIRQPIGQKLQLFGGVKNLFDWTQPNPLINPMDPFSETFDPEYVYGPMQGRRFFVGVRLTLGDA